MIRVILQTLWGLFLASFVCGAWYLVVKVLGLIPMRAWTMICMGALCGFLLFICWAIGRHFWPGERSDHAA